MQVKIDRPEPGRVMVSMDGPLDRHTVPDVRNKLLKTAARKGVKEIEVDFSLVSALDTAGIALMVELLRPLTRKGGTLRLKSLSEPYKRMIRLAELDGVLKSS